MGAKWFTVLMTCVCAGFVFAAVTRSASAQGDGALCHGPNATLEQRVTACSAIIAAGTADKRPLADAYAQRGFVYTLTRKLDLARLDLDLAIKIDPDYARGYINRANFWTVMHQPDRALADSETAIRLAPDEPLSYFVHGSASLNLGHYDGAIADYSKALSMRPSLGVDIFNMRDSLITAKATRITPLPITTRCSSCNQTKWARCSTAATRCATRRIMPAPPPITVRRSSWRRAMPAAGKDAASSAR